MDMIRKIKNRLFRKQNCVVNIEHFTRYAGVVFVSGWAFFEKTPVKHIYVSTASGGWKKVAFETRDSADVAKAHGLDHAGNARFAFTVNTQDIAGDVFALQLKFTAGLQSHIKQHLQLDGINRGPYRKFVPDFFKTYVEEAKPSTILEIGSRARSGVNNRDTYIPKSLNAEFTGVDVLDGECVDVVCDAHELSQHVENDKYDLVYSLNVFEHLLMPWKVVLELNKVMKTNGIVMIFTHHSFPLHDLPWDYYRFSDNAWYSLFNKETGFEVIKTELIDRVSIVPRNIYEGSAGVKDGDAFIHSAVIARKISDTKLEWNVDAASIIETEYPL